MKFAAIVLLIIAIAILLVLSVLVLDDPQVDGRRTSAGLIALALACACGIVAAARWL